MLVVIFYLHEESNTMHENFSFMVNCKVKVPFCHKKSRPFDLLFLTSLSGFEPLAFRLGGERSILLSYRDNLWIAIL